MIRDDTKMFDVIKIGNILKDVESHPKLTPWKCGVKLGLVYAVIPRLSRYSMGLSEPRDILIRSSLYQRMYESIT
jgi:hypothetical protein